MISNRTSPEDASERNGDETICLTGPDDDSILAVTVRSVEIPGDREDVEVVIEADHVYAYVLVSPKDARRLAAWILDHTPQTPAVGRYPTDDMAVMALTRLMQDAGLDPQAAFDTAVAWMDDHPKKKEGK